MYVHTPTGKACRIVATEGQRAFCDFGPHGNPFTWVVASELKWVRPKSGSESSNLQIVDFNDSEPVMLAAVIETLRRHETMQTATIYCNTRDPNGWLEYHLRINYHRGGSLTIGCIQRTPGAEIEFHS